MSTREAAVAQILDRELHDLVQPIARLQCRLEIGLMLGEDKALLEAVQGGLEDLAKLTSAVTRMRAVLAMLPDGEQG